MTIEEVIARALLHYVDPPGRTLWGAERSEDKARAVLSALDAAGLVVMPDHMTPEMKAAARVVIDAWKCGEREDATDNDIYQAVIRAATSPDAPVPAVPVRRG